MRVKHKVSVQKFSPLFSVRLNKLFHTQLLFMFEKPSYVILYYSRWAYNNTTRISNDVNGLKCRPQPLEDEIRCNAGSGFYAQNPAFRAFNPGGLGRAKLKRCRGRAVCYKYFMPAKSARPLSEISMKMARENGTEISWKTQSTERAYPNFHRFALYTGWMFKFERSAHVALARASWAPIQQPIFFSRIRNNATLREPELSLTRLLRPWRGWNTFYDKRKEYPDWSNLIMIIKRNRRNGATKGPCSRIFSATCIILLYQRKDVVIRKTWRSRYSYKI